MRAAAATIPPVLANPILWEEGFANRKALNCMNSRLARLTLTTDEWLQAGTFSQLELLWDLPRSSGFSTLPTSLLLLPKRSIHLTSFAHTKYIKIWHLWCYYSSDAVALSINDQCSPRCCFPSQISLPQKLLPWLLTDSACKTTPFMDQRLKSTLI